MVVMQYYNTLSSTDLRYHAGTAHRTKVMDKITGADVNTVNLCKARHVAWASYCRPR